MKWALGNNESKKTMPEWCPRWREKSPTLNRGFKQISPYAIRWKSTWQQHENERLARNQAQKKMTQIFKSLHTSQRYFQFHMELVHMRYDDMELQVMEEEEIISGFQT